MRPVLHPSCRAGVLAPTLAATPPSLMALPLCGAAAAGAAIWGGAVARMITADEITSSELVSALGRGAAEAAEAARLAGGALEGVAGESQAAFAGGGSLSRVLVGKLIPALTSSALTAADELQVPRQRQPSLAPLSAQPSAPQLLSPQPLPLSATPAPIERSSRCWTASTRSGPASAAGRAPAGAEGARPPYCGRRAGGSG